MKKYLVLLIALSACFASCVSGKDEVNPGGFVDVIFDLGVENAPETRAISDGTGATQLMWAIFNEGGEVVHVKTVKNDVTDLLTSKGHTISVSLAKGKVYKAVFWAQNPGCTAYSVSDDMKVTVNYDALNNDEARDAFFVCSDAFTADGSSVVSVVLKRPFAQVNVGAFPWDLEYAIESGNDVKLSAATIKNVPNVINLFDGAVEGAVDATYTLAAIPQETLMVDVDDNGEKETYEWMSMSYVLASAEGSTHAMQFTFADENGNGAFTFGDNLGDVSIKRNWRTNIVGQILTGDISFNIKIDPVYEGETINSTGLYYNFTEDTVIENKEFVFNSVGHEAIFSTENNNKMTLNNVTFSGTIWQIAFGDYRDKGNYVSYTNELNNVVGENMVVGCSISNVATIDYMSVLFYLRGNIVINDCKFTGTTTAATPVTDPNGTVQEVLPYDCGVPNFCDATFNNTTVDRLYAWSHSKITIKNSKIGYIRCSTHKHSDPKAHLTIDAGTVVDEIFVSSSGLQKYLKDANGNYIYNPETGKKVLGADFWSPSLIIKSGAKVNKLDYNGRTNEDVLIEEGAIIGKIVNLAE